MLCGIFNAVCAFALNTDDVFSVTWNINNVDSIDGNATAKLSEPVVIDTEYGPAVWFDGIDDGLIVVSNPLEGATAFTAEVIFKPDSSYPDNEAQRFIHIQNPTSDNRRILIELRLTQDHQWYLDTFIKSELSSLALMDENLVHPVGEWYHAAMIYENRMMKHYVNGIEELSGEVDFLPISNGYTSIGTRMNKRSWFKGTIRILKVTHRVLSPDEFLVNDTGIQEDRAILSDYIFIQNYPNPFNPDTQIRYTVPYQNNVKLSIYNITGKEVAVLFDGYQMAGNYEQYWNAVDGNGQRLSSGVYLLQMITGKYCKTIKMIYSR
jgi:hypothetical protein